MGILEVYGKVGLSLDEVYKMVWKTVIKCFVRCNA